MFVIAQVLGHLRIQRDLEHVLGQLVEQPVLADQLDTLFPRLRKQLLSELPAINFCSRIRVFLTSSVLPAKLTPGVSDQDQIHRYPDSPGRGCAFVR